jgi:hypothetical protein
MLNSTCRCHQSWTLSISRNWEKRTQNIIMQVNDRLMQEKGRGWKTFSPLLSLLLIYFDYLFLWMEQFVFYVDAVFCLHTCWRSISWSASVLWMVCWSIGIEIGLDIWTSAYICSLLCFSTQTTTKSSFNYHVAKI